MNYRQKKRKKLSQEPQLGSHTWYFIWLF